MEDLSKPSWEETAAIQDRSIVRAWVDEAECIHAQLSRSLRRISEKQNQKSYAPGVSVVVPSYLGHAYLEACLQSLARQSLNKELFEVILVLNGPYGDTLALLNQFKTEYRGLTLRVIELREPGVARARNAGIAAASRAFTTFIDDDDYVSPNFLEVLLSYASTDVIPVAALVDVDPEGEDAENTINISLRRRAFRMSSPNQLPAATSFNAGKLVSTELIKNASYDPELTSGEDVLFWTSVAVANDIVFLPCSAASGAIYYRRMRSNSVSRKPLTIEFAVRERLKAITRLENLMDGRVGSRKLVRNRMRAQASFINSYLSANPGDRERVTELLDGSSIVDMPYEIVNQGLERGLVIAYAFPPYVDTSAIVMAKRVRERAEVVDVISNRLDGMRKVDASTRRIAGPFIAEHRLLDAPVAFSNWSSMEEFTWKGLRTLEDWWAAKGGYDWLYSRAHFAASHFLAAALKLLKPSIMWRAEFSDPLSRGVVGNERGTPASGRLIDHMRAGLERLGLPVPNSDNCFVWCEEMTYGLADELIFTNEYQLEFMLSYCTTNEAAQIAREKAVIAPHPTLPTAFYSAVHHKYNLEPGQIHLAYFGNFYATRGLDDVLVAMSRMDIPARKRIKLHVFTSNSGELADRASELELARNVEINPFVPYLEFLNLAREFDYVIVNDARTGGTHKVNPYLPSKWSDYRGSGSRIWGIVEEGSALSRCDLDYMSPVGEIDAAVEVLHEIASGGDSAGSGRDGTGSASDEIRPAQSQ